MGRTTAWKESLVNFIFLNIPVANIGDATGLRAAVGPGNLWLSLHSSDPGEGGSQTTNEVSYTGYARIRVSRTNPSSSINFVLNGAAVSIEDIMHFPLCTGGTVTATHLGVGTDDTGSGRLWYYGPLSSSLSISTSIMPAINPNNIVKEI